MRRSVLALVLFVAGCAGAAGSAASLATLGAWGGYSAALAEIGTDGPVHCADGFGTWFADWGVRGVACTAAHALAAGPGEPTPASLVAAAPMAPFVSGPHALPTGQADLDAPRTFGRYDPAFVRWLAGAAIPTDPATVALTAPTYDRHFARTARIYWLTYADLAADGFPGSVPFGTARDYALFLDGGPVPDGAEGYDAEGMGNGGFSVYAFTDMSEGVIPRVGVPVANDWTIRYEANTAYGFWLRRRADGTLGLWRDALGRLVQTYDADWLADAR